MAASAGGGMSIETPADRDGIRDVGRVVRLTLERLEAMLEPGVSTGELDAAAADLFAEHGAESAPAAVYGFPGTVLISVNDEVVHGVPGPRVLRRGDLVTVDVTARKGGYVADAARTVLLGPGSAVARGLRDCVRAAFDRAMEVAVAGAPVREIGRVISEETVRRGYAVIPQLTGHGVGRTIHEAPIVPNFHDPEQTDVLTAGLVLAIEPIVCAGGVGLVRGEDGWTYSTSDGSLAAHHENTIVVTDGAPEVLTAA